MYVHPVLLWSRSPVPRYSSAEDEDLICGSKPVSVEDAFEQASSLSRRDAVVLLMQSGKRPWLFALI